MRQSVAILGGILLAAISFIAAWILSANVTTQGNQTAFATQVVAAAAATEQQRLRTPPTLLNPADAAVFDNAAAVKLEWDWTRPLAADEVYDVRVWRDGDPAYGITWTQDKKFDLTQWLLYQQPGDFLWSIAVLKKGAEGQDATEISAAAAPRRFTMSEITMKIIDLPPGFKADLYARLPQPQPTVITFAPDGSMIVLSLDGPITRLEDADGDHIAEKATVIYDDARDLLNHAVGLALHDGKTYISDAGRISIISDSDGDGMLDSLQPIVEGLPTWQHIFHSNNGIAFGPDGKLYVSVGSTSDHGPLKEPLEASILRMNADGSGLEVFATGIRNAYDLAFSPDGELFTADNSPDEMDESLQYLPPEELNYIREGKNYGFPDAYGNLTLGTSTEPPVTEFFTSSATSGLTVYAADQFPPEYRGVYVAEFGTGAGFPLSRGVQNGEMVVFVRLEKQADGTYRGKWTPFAQFKLDLGTYSPIDVTVGPDGALYIAEWTTATIYRVTYTGEVEAEATPIVQSAAETLGETIFRNGVEGAPACITCHVLEAGKTAAGPSLLNLGEIAGTRVSGLSAEEYVRQSILHPNDFIVPGYSAGFMFQNYAAFLSDERVDALAAYVLSLGKEP
jgi:glucose/arabinose dehydrogenase